MQVALVVIYIHVSDFDFAVSPIATIQTNISGVITSFVGGVYLVLADNNAINSIRDFSGKVIEVSSMDDLGSGQAQWLDMQSHGLDLMVDPAQVHLLQTNHTAIACDIPAWSKPELTCDRCLNRN